MAHDFTMLASLLDAVVVANTQGVIVFVNKVTNALFGYDDGELVGQSVSVLCDPDTAQRHDAFIRRFVTVGNRSVMGTANREVHGRCKDGTVVPVAISLTETASGQEKLFIATFRDLRGQREAEQQMLKAKQDQVEKEAASNASEDMLRYLEHEVRQPLNGIMGMLELMDSDLGSDADVEKEDLKEKVKVARRCADHLLTIISDFVDVRRMESGLAKLTLGEGTLYQVAKDAVDILHTNLEDSENVEFAFVGGEGYDPAALYQLDTARVRQVLVNLIGNGLKFTKQGTVTLRISVAREGGRDVVSFEVTDTGCGVSPEIMAKLFPGAERADADAEGDGEEMQIDDGPDAPKSAKSKTPRQVGANAFVSGNQDDLRTFQGTGLGLRLSQLLATAMQGTITCRSEFPPKQNPDGSCSGATFTFEVPLLRVGVMQDQAASPIVARRSRGSTPKKEEASAPAAAAAAAPVQAAQPAAAAAAAPSVAMSPALMHMRRAVPSSPLASEVQRARPASKWASSSSMAHESRFAPHDAAGARAPAAPPTRGRRLNFLVVDDMMINRRVLRTILHTLGHSIEEAENGEVAIEKVEKTKFDLIFMDVRMPVLGGREATLRIRSHQNTALRSIPIVAITGDVCAEDIKRSLDAGMNEVLGKPITKESVVRVIEKLYSS